MDSVTADRALLIDQEDATEANVTLSIETCEEFTGDQTINTYIIDHFDHFLKFLRYLPKRDQDLVLSYYTLGITQTDLGRTFGVTQTICSSQLRLIVRAIGALIMFQGEPTEQQLATVLSSAGYSTVLMHQFGTGQMIPVPLAKLIIAYVETKSFAAVAFQFDVHRPDIRRSFRSVSDIMQESPNPTHQGVGAWLKLLIEKMAATHSGYTRCTQEKMKNIQRTDPECLGEFRVSIDERGFDRWFSGKAAR